MRDKTRGELAFMNRVVLFRRVFAFFRGSEGAKLPTPVSKTGKKRFRYVVAQIFFLYKRWIKPNFSRFLYFQPPPPRIFDLAFGKQKWRLYISGSRNIVSSISRTIYLESYRIVYSSNQNFSIFIVSSLSNNFISWKHYSKGTIFELENAEAADNIFDNELQVSVLSFF